MLKDGVRAKIEKNSYPVPPIFRLMAKKGNVEEHTMYNTYNMGIGLVVAVRPEDVDTAMKAIRDAGEYPYRIGVIEEGEKEVVLV
jgi:phosphoribosylformylglycinamidine cyclo-ligase